MRINLFNNVNKQISNQHNHNNKIFHLIIVNVE